MISHRWIGPTKLLTLVAVLAAGGWLAGRGPIAWLASPSALVARATPLTNQWWAPAAFVIAYALLSAVDFSGLVLTLAGGALFGFGEGLLLNTLGANLGASGAFWLARLLGRDGVRRLLSDRLAGADRLAEGQGFGWLLRLRLIPLVPFNLLNLGAGLTRMQWRPFALATTLGILPGTVVYTWFANELVAGSREASRAALLRVAVAAAVVIALSFLPRLWRRRAQVQFP